MENPLGELHQDDLPMRMQMSTWNKSPHGCWVSKATEAKKLRAIEMAVVRAMLEEVFAPRKG